MLWIHHYQRKCWLSLFVLLPCTFLLSGCWDRIEVNDLAIITMAGVDLTEDNQVELSVKIQLTSQPSSQPTTTDAGGGGGGRSGASVVRTATGMNLADAASRLQQVLSRKVFWGHNEVIVIGNEFAKEHTPYLMEYFLRHPETRERANLFVSRTTAKEVLQLDPTLEHSVSDKLREMSKLQTGLNVTLKQLAQMMVSECKVAVIPYLDVKPQMKKQDPFPYIQGTVVLHEGKMVGDMDDKATRGLMWARNELDRGTVTIMMEENEDAFISFQLIRSHTQVIPQIDGERWSVTLRIHTLDDIIENSSQYNLSRPELIEEMEKKLEEDIRNRVNLAAEQAQEKLKVDVFGFADAFYRKYPEQWQQHKDQWHERFTQLAIEYDLNAKISRPGMTTRSIIILEQE